MSETVPLPIADEIALRQLSDAYAAAVDARDLRALRACFLPSGRLTLFFGGRAPREYEGHAGLEQVIDELAPFDVTLHHVGTCALAGGLTPDAASGTVTTVAHHVSVKDGEARDLVLHMRYADTYDRHADATWRIRERRAHVTFSDRRMVRLP